METAANTGISDKVIQEIKTIAQQCNVDKVCLFGSRARGDYKERSDVDIFKTDEWRISKQGRRGTELWR